MYGLSRGKHNASVACTYLILMLTRCKMQSLEVVSAQWRMVLIPAYHDRYSDSLGDGLSVNSRYKSARNNWHKRTWSKKEGAKRTLFIVCFPNNAMQLYRPETIRSTNASHDPFQTNPNPSFCIPQTPSPKLYHPARASFSAPSIISSMILFCIIIALSNITISSSQHLSCSSRLHSACRFTQPFISAISYAALSQPSLNSLMVLALCELYECMRLEELLTWQGEAALTWVVFALSLRLISRRSFLIRGKLSSISWRWFKASVKFSFNSTRGSSKVAANGSMLGSESETKVWASV